MRQLKLTFLAIIATLTTLPAQAAVSIVSGYDPLALVYTNGQYEINRSALRLDGADFTDSMLSAGLTTTLDGFDFTGNATGEVLVISGPFQVHPDGEIGPSYVHPIYQTPTIISAMDAPQPLLDGVHSAAIGVAYFPNGPESRSPGTAVGITAIVVEGTGMSEANVRAWVQAADGYILAYYPTTYEAQGAGNDYLIHFPAAPLTPEQVVQQNLTSAQTDIATITGVGNSLNTKIADIALAISVGDYASAYNQISTLKNQINAQTGKKISTADAAELLTMLGNMQAALDTLILSAP